MLSLPAIDGRTPDGAWPAINDVSIHRQPGQRVADLEYGRRATRSAASAATGSSSPRRPGSTGYNLANGGPVMAWGVQGFVVSFIAPHSLTARPLVVAPADQVSVDNRSREEAVEVTVDGRPMCLLQAGESIQARFIGRPGHARPDSRHAFYSAAAPEVRRGWRSTGLSAACRHRLRAGQPLVAAGTGW